jgi:hypothetical protein
MRSLRMGDCRQRSSQPPPILAEDTTLRQELNRAKISLADSLENSDTPPCVAEGTTLSQELNRAKRSLADSLENSDTPPWVAGKMREDVVSNITLKAKRDPGFENALALHFTLEHPDVNENPEYDKAKHVKDYIKHMKLHSTFGGEPEVNAAAEVLSSPIVIFDQMPDGSWRLSNHVNNQAHGLTVFLFHSNPACRFSAHYDYALPAVLSSELSEGYGHLLTACMAMVHVQPIRVTVDYMSDSNLGSVNPGKTSFWIFGIPGDGSCLFNALEMHRKATEIATHAQDLTLRFWSRELPFLCDTATQRCKANQLVWNRDRELREVQASGGVGVYDETSIIGMERLLELVYLMLPWLRVRKHIMLDVGHGMGQTLFFSSNYWLTCIGIEQDKLLHIHAKELSVRLDLNKKVALRFGSSNDLDTNSNSFEGVSLVCMYESMGGRVEGPNAVHMALIRKILQTSSVMCFTTTKMQKKLLEEYCAKDDEIGILMLSWTGCKVRGTVHRKGNSPQTCMYFRNEAIYDQPPPSSSSPPTSDLVQSMVSAAQHREEGRINLISYDSSLHGTNVVKSFKMNWPGVIHGNQEIRIVYGFPFSVQDNLTGLNVVAGSTVDVSFDKGVVVGFGSSFPSPEKSLGVFLLRLPNGEHIFASQEKLLRVVGSEVMELTKDHFDAIKRFGRLQSNDGSLPVRMLSHRIRTQAEQAAKTAEQVAAQQAVKTAEEAQSRADKKNLQDAEELAKREQEKQQKNSDKTDRQYIRRKTKKANNTQNTVKEKTSKDKLKTSNERSGKSNTDKQRGSPQFDDTPFDLESEEDTNWTIHSSSSVNEVGQRKHRRVSPMAYINDPDLQPILQPILDRLKDQMDKISVESNKQSAVAATEKKEIAMLVDLVQRQGEIATLAMNDRKKEAKEKRKVEKEDRKKEQIAIDDQKQMLIANLLKEGFSKHNAEIENQHSLTSVLQEMKQTKKLFKDAMTANKKHQQEQEIASMKVSAAEAQKNVLLAQMELEKWKQQDYGKYGASASGHYGKYGASGHGHRRRRRSSSRSSYGSSASSSPRQRFTCFVLSLII